MDDRTKHIVFYSGGKASFLAAHRVIGRFGAASVTLLFTDTLIEDADLYRFLDESSAALGVRRGRTCTVRRCAGRHRPARPRRARWLPSMRSRLWRISPTKPPTTTRQPKAPQTEPPLMGEIEIPIESPKE